MDLPRVLAQVVVLAEEASAVPPLVGEAAPVESPCRQTGDVEHGWGDVDVSYQSSVLRAGTELSGPAYVQRDSRSLVVRCALPHEPVLAPHEPVVGEEEGKRFVDLPRALQCAHDLSDDIIHTH